MEQILKPTRLDFLLDADQNSTFRNEYTIEQLEEQKEEVETVGDRTLIFAWKGLAKNWKVYLAEQKRQKKIQDNESWYYEKERDPRDKIWGKGGNDIY